jgi:opacity protein-like surface antigen
LLHVGLNRGAESAALGVVVNRAKLALLTGTSLCLSCGFSQAADMPLKAPVRPVAVVDPWVGWYAGGNIGYSWGKTETEISVGPLGQLPDFGGAFTFPGGTSYPSSKVNGIIGGVQVGYVGRIAPHWLGGIEADFQWSGQKGSARNAFGPTSTDCSRTSCEYTSAHDVTAKLNYFGTFRGRVGPEFNGIWLYGTAGFAFGKVSVSGNHSITLLDTSSVQFGFPPEVIGAYWTPFSYSQLKGGWTAGIGAEGLIGNGPWRWKVEYLHIDLGTINGGMFATTVPFVQVNTTRFTDDIVRVGFNYGFGDDKVSRPGLPVKAPPAALLAWTGVYVGVNAGYLNSVGRTNTDAAISSLSTSSEESPNLVNSATNQFNNRSNGFLGGVQAGFNYQFSPSFVAGVEADIQGTTLRRDFSATNSVISQYQHLASWITTTAVSSRLDYLGTVRGRIGVTPRPDLLLYSTGGLAFGGVRSSTQINFNNDGSNFFGGQFVTAPGFATGSLSDTIRTGWAVGGGLEWMFSSNWTAKLEYLYYNLGSASYPTSGYAVDAAFPFASGVASVATRSTVRFEGDIVRVGLNYKFGGGPVVAEY